MLLEINRESNYILGSATKYGRNLIELSQTASDIASAEKEVAYELDKVFDRIVERYGGLEELKKRYADNPLIIKTEIDQEFERMELSAQAERFGKFWASQYFQIQFEWVESSKSKGQEFFGDFRDTLQAIDTEGVFRDVIKNLRNMVGLEESIQKKYQENTKELEVLNRANTERLDLSKQIEKARTESLSSDMDTAVAAQERLNILLKQKEVIDAQNKVQREQIMRENEVLKQTAEYFNLRYTSQNTGAGKTSKSDPQVEKLKEQIRLIKEANKAYEDYIKVYDAATAKEKVSSDFEAAFAGVGLTFDMDFDVSGMIDSLEHLFNTVNEKGKKVINETLAPLEKETEIKVREEGLEEIKQKFETLFGDYELTLQLEKYGSDANIIGGALGVNMTDLGDLKKFYESIKNIEKEYGTEGAKLAQEIEKKIADAERNALEERTEQYAKYLKTAISERAQILLQAQRDMANIDSLNVSESAKTTMKLNVAKEASQNKSKVDWEEFKGSAFYIQMFEDLEMVSSRSLDVMEQKLESIRESLKDLPPEDLKEVIDALNKIKDEQSERGNPFKNLIQSAREYINYLKERKELEDRLAEGQENEENISKTVTAQEIAVEKAKEYYNSQVDIYGVESNQAKEAKRQLNTQEQLLSGFKKEQKEIIENNGEINEGLNESSEKAEEFQNKLAKTADVFNILADGIGTLSESLENMLGENFSSGLSDALSSAQEIFGGLGQAASGAMKLASGNPLQRLQGGFQLASGLFNTIGGIFGIGDKKKERQIQREMELVEQLQSKYEDLEEAIDEAYSLDTVKESTENAIENLEAQNKRYQNMINAENDKKDSDGDRIKEWEAQIKENKKRIEELREELVSTVTAGIFDDIVSAADSFTSAWLEAFRETGDGLSGLQSEFDKMMEDLVVRQATMAITSNFVKKWQDELNKYVNPNDTELTVNEAKDWAEYVKSTMPALSESLEALVGTLEEDGVLDSNKEAELGGLQQGIQSITEETAQALEALLNSIRFFSSDSNIQLRNIYNSLLNPAQENPFLVEMKNHTRLLSSISTTLVSMTMISQTGRRGLRVYIS